MQGRHRISRRIIKRFLQMAATTFAIGIGTTPALADNDDQLPATGNREESASVDESGDEMNHDAYQHAFMLAEPPAGAPHRAERASLRVLDAKGRKLTQLALHGDSMVGPFADGVYTVLLRSHGLTEVHRIRIGPDTLPYLHFTETV